MTGSLVACPKQRIKKILSLFESLREAIEDAMMVCGLPLPRYVYKNCCLDKGHIDNFGDSDYAEVFNQASEATRSCLQAAFPSDDQLSTFSGEDEDVVFEELLSFGNLPIWAKGDPVHITTTPYGDVEAALLGKLNSPSGELQPNTARKRIESVVTRAQTPAKSAPTPGWILGDCAGAQRGRRGPGRGFGGGSGCGGRRGMPPGWRGTG